jgi:hypothetical protein
MAQPADITKALAFKKYTLACHGELKVVDLMKKLGLSEAKATDFAAAFTALNIETLKGLAEYDGHKIYFVTKPDHIPDILNGIETAVVGHNNALNVKTDLAFLHQVTIDLVLLLQPVTLGPDGNLGETGKNKVKHLVELYVANGGVYDRQHGVNPRSIVTLHTAFLDCVFDDARPFQLKKSPLKTFVRSNDATSVYDVNNATVVRLHCRRCVQAITIAAGLVLQPEVLTRFVRDRVLDVVVASERPDGTVIPVADRAFYLGTPSGFERPVMQFLDNSELDGPSLSSAFDRLILEIDSRLMRDFRLLNASTRHALDYCNGMGLLTQTVSSNSLSEDVVEEPSAATPTAKTGAAERKICAAYQTESCVLRGKCPKGDLHKCAHCEEGGHPQSRCPKLVTPVKAGGRKFFDRDRRDRDFDRSFSRDYGRRSDYDRRGDYDRRDSGRGYDRRDYGRPDRDSYSRRY